MIHRRFVGLSSALVVLWAILGTTRADENQTADAAAKLVLFDGKTLDGWKDAGFRNAPAAKVEDGAMVLPAASPVSGITSTRKDLPTTNYELSYEAMRPEGRDFFAAATFPVGKSFVTFVNGGWGGSVTGLSNLNGADASENETTRFVKYENKTWYRFRVRVTDKAIRGWVDDKLVFAVELDGREVGTRIEVRPNQPLGFSAWRSSGAIRKVEVRNLTADEVAANDKFEG
jgi:hypothetical protein